MNTPFYTIGEACFRILRGNVDGIWVHKETKEHVFSTLHSSLHLFPHALTFHRHVSSSIIQAKQQAFFQCWVAIINPKPSLVGKKVNMFFFFEPCDVHSKPWSLEGGCERHFKLQYRVLRWTYIIMLNYDWLITRIIVEMMGQMGYCEIANCSTSQCLSYPSKALFQNC